MTLVVPESRSPAATHAMGNCGPARSRLVWFDESAAATCACLCALWGQRHLRVVLVVLVGGRVKRREKEKEKEKQQLDMNACVSKQTNQRAVMFGGGGRDLGPAPALRPDPAFESHSAGARRAQMGRSPLRPLLRLSH